MNGFIYVGELKEHAFSQTLQNILILIVTPYVVALCNKYHNKRKEKVREKLREQRSKQNSNS